MSEELANLDSMALKMDRDPSSPSTIAAEMEIARGNLERMRNNGQGAAYWTGVMAGLELAFDIMREKDG